MINQQFLYFLNLDHNFDLFTQKDGLKGNSEVYSKSILEFVELTASTMMV